MKLLTKLEVALADNANADDLRKILHIEGQVINPNDKVVVGISKGLLRTRGECPCFQDVPIEDKICPCKELRENNKCKCNLYIQNG